ncbi:phage tail tape measure protein [Kozakia baliensis]|uniref:Uncharacterized protein n=1 Tax=Kozakia baliensis TaxID=153496 RepID=A0A1D8UTG2_9PROT|nr:phage tail tape measure protein [Kozakia baliensis]AOX16919.1 hypothetical protein A0U89_06970 [Kozakia baliensis]GBR25594.1 phage related tail protein [Kozakia baliensis NRIC 0488]GEL64034.1 hypothetical protein KBA01_13200 [Kozakia baliensis]
MASGFTITISATDRASRVMDNITKRINAMNAPLRRFRGSAGRFLDATGINRVAGAFRNWASAGLSVASSLVKIVEPLGALTSVASIAGIYKMTTAWAQFGSKLGFDAQRIGIMPQKLQDLQGAAEEAGASAGSMTSGLRSLRDNMVNALGGRDAQSLQYFRQFQINIGTMKGGIRDVTQVLPELADKIAAIKDPTLQARVATQLLGSAGEDLLPFLRLGAKGMAQYEKDASRFGLTNRDGADKANALRLSLTQLKLASVGLSYSIAQQVAPSLQGLLGWFTDLISKNREVIAAKVGQAVKTFADWVKSVNWKQVGTDISDIYTGVNDVAQALGGWGSVATLVAEGMIAKLFAPVLLQIAKVIFMAGKATKALVAMSAAKYGAWADAAVDAGGASGALKSGGKGLLKLGLRGGLLAALLYGTYEAFKPHSLGTGDTLMKGKPLPADIEAAGRTAAARNGLDPNWFLSLLQTEQGGYNNVSKAGAFGPAQLMPGTAAGLGLPSGINAPGYTWQANLEGGARYARQMLDRFKGNRDAAAAAYNAGPGNNGVLKFAATGDASGLPWETKEYIRSIDAQTANRANQMKLEIEVHQGNGGNSHVRVRGASLNGTPVNPKVSHAMPDYSSGY